jgi:hypothetical protein
MEESMLAVANRVPVSRRYRLLFVVALLSAATTVARAGEVDTEHLFGFTTGADTGNVGERELESEVTDRFGKQAGSYNAFSQTYEVKIAPVENFQIGVGTALAYFGISGAPGLPDRQQTTLQGLSVDLRYKLIDNQRGPFSLTIIAEPRWDRLDDIGGGAVNGYGGTFTVAIDKELIADRLFGAVNLLYDTEASDLIVAAMWQRDSRIGISTALSLQIRPALFVGGEVRYQRVYSGLGLDTFAGQAVFAGPTTYYQISKNWAVSAAWDFQVYGKTAQGGWLDLTHFERQQVLARFNYTF